MAFNHEYGGLKAVSSKTGMKIYSETIAHDDGMRGFGGNRVMGIGDLGSGKTSFMIQSVLKIFYTPNMKKQDFLKNPDVEEMYPETIIWRGRSRDYWNVFTDENYRKSFPGQLAKPLKIFYFKEDKLEFIEYKDNQPEIMRDIDVYQYSDVSDLYTNLVKGGINVVYAPVNYSLSQLLKKNLNSILMLDRDDKRYYDEDKDYPVPSFVFWYDLFYFLIEIDKNFDRVKSNYRDIRWITFLFDEAHQIFPLTKAPLWHLVDHFAENEMIDTRRVNISIWAMVHEMDFVYWKIANRFNVFVWFVGSKECKKKSRISGHLLRKLPLGTVIIENKNKEFGRVDFPEIPNQPPALTVKGYE